MDMRPKSWIAATIQGQLLRLSERREVAIYLHNDALWVADFIDGDGELIDATTWFRFNCGTHASPQARRRMALESAIPLSEHLVERIEHLHRSAKVRTRGPLARFLVAVAHRPRNRVATMLLKPFLRSRMRRGNPSGGAPDPSDTRVKASGRSI
jgi:hypothetical protein